MNFLLLGIDSVIAGIAICPIVSPRARAPLAAMFGVADLVAFLVGTGLHVRVSDGTSQFVTTAVLVTLGIYLLVVVAGTRAFTGRWTVWVLPWALTLDNLTYGAVSEHSGSLAGQALQQAASSALLAYVGLMTAVLLPRLVPEVGDRKFAIRLTGAALVAAAGALMLAG